MSRENPDQARQAGRALDAANFFLADVRDGLGPYLAVYLLTEQHWDEARIGVVMSVADHRRHRGADAGRRAGRRDAGEAARDGGRGHHGDGGLAGAAAVSGLLAGRDLAGHRACGRRRSFRRRSPPSRSASSAIAPSRGGSAATRPSTMPATRSPRRSRAARAYLFGPTVVFYLLAAHGAREPRERARDPRTRHRPRPRARAA